MSYATGTATTGITLLQAFATWIGGLSGWTVDASASDGSGWRLHAHKGTQYIHMRACVNESSGIWVGGVFGAGYSLNLYCGTSAYNSGNAWNAQAGGPVPSGQTYNVGVSMTLNAGPFTSYDFFDDGAGDHIRIVVQQSAGIFSHMGFGSSVNKAGAWGGTNGGAYFFGSKGGYYGNYTSVGEYGSGKTSYCPGAYMDANSSATMFVHAGSTGIDSHTSWMSMTNSAAAMYGGMPKNLRSGIPALASFAAVPITDNIQTRLTTTLSNLAILHPSGSTQTGRPAARPGSAISRTPTSPTRPSTGTWHGARSPSARTPTWCSQTLRS